MTNAVILSETAARTLTERIRKAGEDFGRLLLDAHDGEAWRVMGYATWGDYVAGEFTFTRGQSYKLLNQERVSRAAGERVTQREAAAVSHEIHGDVPSEPSPAVQRLLAEQREFSPIPKPSGRRGGYKTPMETWRRWCEDLEALSEQMNGEPLDPDAQRVMRRLENAVTTILKTGA